MMSDEEDSSPGFSLDIFASLDASIGALSLEMKRANNAAARARALLPRQIALFQQSTSATAVDLLSMGGPQNGRKWEIRLLNTYSVTSAGFVAMATTVTTWYVGQKVIGNAPGILPINMARWQSPSVPAQEDFSGDTITVLPGELLMAGLTGIPAAPTQIMCIAVIDDMPLYVGSVDVAT